jgi:glycerate kinase
LPNGERSADPLLVAVRGRKKFLKIREPFMEVIESFYGLIDGDSTTVIKEPSAPGFRSQRVIFILKR